jgi:hypothetical protein
MFDIISRPRVGAHRCPRLTVLCLVSDIDFRYRYKSMSANSQSTRQAWTETICSTHMFARAVIFHTPALTNGKHASREEECDFLYDIGQSQ